MDWWRGEYWPQHVKDYSWAGSEEEVQEDQEEYLEGLHSPPPVHRLPVTVPEDIFQLVLVADRALHIRCLIGLAVSPFPIPRVLSDSEIRSFAPNSE